MLMIIVMIRMMMIMILVSATQTIIPLILYVSTVLEKEEKWAMPRTVHKDYDRSFEVKNDALFFLLRRPLD